MALLTVILVTAGGALGGQNGVVTAFIFALLMNGLTYWFSDKIVLRMYGAKEVSPDDVPKLYRVLRDLTLRAQMPMPRVYVIPQDTPNAFATGRDEKHAAVAVTEGILDILSESELRGVLAHELSHVKNRDILIGTIAATMAGAISMLAHIAQWGLIFGGLGHKEGGNPIAALAMIILAPLAAMLVQLAISRGREYGADATGARISGDPLSLANALKKLQRGVERIPMEANPATAHMFIVSPLTGGGGGLMTLFSTHPPLEERISRLEMMAKGSVRVR